MPKIKAYYFKDKVTGKERNTPVFATSAAAAKKKLRRPSPDNAVVSAVRTPQSGEGVKGWSRVRKDGKGPEASKHGKGRGFGPKRK